MDFVSLGFHWIKLKKELPNHECVDWDMQILGVPKEVSGYSPELVPNFILRFEGLILVNCSDSLSNAGQEPL